MIKGCNLFKSAMANPNRLENKFLKNRHVEGQNLDSFKELSRLFLSMADLNEKKGLPYLLMEIQSRIKIENYNASHKPNIQKSMQKLKVKKILVLQEFSVLFEYIEKLVVFVDYYLSLVGLS